MGTDLIYNGVELHNVVTREWEQEAVYDQSKTDLVMHRFKITVEGILHAKSSGTDPPISASPAWIERQDLADGAPRTVTADIYNDIRNRLLTPRKKLEIRMGGQMVLMALPAVAFPTDLNRDVENGPQPQSASLTHIAGHQLFRVRFVVHFAKAECPGTSYSDSWVLNNRWSVSETMDQDFFTTRTIAGQMRLSLPIQVTQQDFRHLIVPSLEEGFRREHIEYSMQPNGLEANYRVTDKQVHTSAPWPATSINGTYTEETSDGITFHSSLNVRLQGDPSSDKRLMIARALQVVDARLNLLEEVGAMNTKYLIESATITEHIGAANSVEASFRIRRVFEDPAAYLARVRTKTLGKPLELDDLPDQPEPYDPVISRKPVTYGYVPQGGEREPILLFLLQCYLQDPCIPIHGVYQGEDHAIQREEPEDDYETTLTQRPPGSIPEPTLEARVSEKAKTYVYTLCTMETKYLQPCMRAAMPIARQFSPGDTADATVVFDLGPGQCIREIRVEAEKVDVWPEIPTPVDTYSDGNLRATKLDFRVRVHPPTLTAEADKHVRRVSAYYRYALNRAPTTAEKVRVGILPTHTFTQDEAAFDPSIAFMEALDP